MSPPSFPKDSWESLPGKGCSGSHEGASGCPPLWCTPSNAHGRRALETRGSLRGVALRAFQSEHCPSVGVGVHIKPSQYPDAHCCPSQQVGKLDRGRHVPASK